MMTTTRKTVSFTHPLLLAALIGVSVPVLQGCFPVVAAGAGTAVMSALDREKLGSRANVSVTSYNRNVLLTGQVADEATRAEAAAIVGEVPNVRGVSNETEIAGVSSLTQRSNDALITSKVKARILDSQRVKANHVKVVTEMSKVYLMGLLTETEAKAAKEVTASTSGVRKVVAIFEIVSPEEARRLDAAGGNNSPKQ